MGISIKSRAKGFLRKLSNRHLKNNGTDSHAATPMFNQEQHLAALIAKHFREFSTSHLKQISKNDTGTLVQGSYASNCGQCKANDENELILVNYHSKISSPAGLRLLLCAIFKTATLTPVQETVYHHVSTQQHLWGDRESLLKSIHDYLVALLGLNPVNEEELLDSLQLLCVHRKQTVTSMQAYATDNKPNTNAVFWPDPTSATHPRSLFDELPYVKSHSFIDKSTAIGSAGSCFAMEIAYRLQAAGFNYIVTEPHIMRDHGYSISCARWGIIFNTPSFRQLVEKAFGHRTTPRILWSWPSNGKLIFRDPFREEVLFESPEEYEKTYLSHLIAAREAFLRSKVFIMTLGMNEVWRLKSDGSVLSRSPWQVSPDLIEKKILTVDDNLRELQCMLDMLRSYNPDIKLILSVSPVPLHATFRGEDTHVVAANCHSKSVLRVTAEAFAVCNPGVYYFPSYEVVMHCTRNPWDADQRHVSSHAVDNVMELFDRMFVTKAGATKEYNC